MLFIIYDLLDKVRIECILFKMYYLRLLVNGFLGNVV